MKTVGLLALVTLALASSSVERRSDEQNERWLESLVPERNIEDQHLRAEREYKYLYDGQLTTSIPQTSQQQSATRIQALVSLVLRSESSAVMSLEQVRFGKQNEQLGNPARMQPFSAFEQIEIEPEQQQRLRKPLRFTYRNNMIRDIEFDGEEKAWSANIKRGVLNLLQVNLKKEREVQQQQSSTEDDQQQKLNQNYRTMEKSVEGDCETMYTIVRAEKQQDNKEQVVLNVTKSINFENCERRPSARYNHRFGQICPSCQAQYNANERSLRSASTAKLNIKCESNQLERCLIEEAEIKSQYDFVQFSEQSDAITTFVSQRLRLVKSGQIEGEVRSPSNPIKSDSQMLFTLDAKAEREQFFLEGNDAHHHNNPYSKIENKKEFLKQLFARVLEYTRERVHEEAPRQFARIVDTIREMKKSELEEAKEELINNRPSDITPEQQQKIKELYIDALAVAGTKQSIEELVKMIKNKEVNKLRASLAIRKLIDTPLVSKKMVEEVMSICESSSECEQGSQLRQAVYLASGSMVRAMCSESRDKWAIQQKQSQQQQNKHKCDPETKRWFLEKIEKKFEEAEKVESRLLALKALSNAAQPESLRFLEKIVRDKDNKYRTITRVEAVLAMRQLVDQTPKKIEKILMPVFMNSEEPSQLRMVAAYQIVRTQPDKLVIDQLTRKLSNERHQQVAQFTRTLLETTANSTNPCEKRLASDITLSLRSARQQPQQSRWWSSRFVRIVDQHSPKYNAYASLSLAPIMSKTNVLPEVAWASVNGNGMKQNNEHVVRIGWHQEGIGRVIRQIIRSQSHKLQSSLEDLLSGNYETPKAKFSFREELREIFAKLHIVDREQPANEKNEPFGIIFMQFKNQAYGYLPFSKELLPENIQEIISSEKSINELIKRSASGLRDVSLPFHEQAATYVHEQSQYIPTSIGIPLKTSVKIPTVMQASGTLKIDVENQKAKISIKNLKASIVTNVVSTVESWSPIVNTGVKVVAQVQAYAPIEASITIDKQETPAKIEITVAPITKERKSIFSMQSRPISFALVWPRSLTKWVEPEERTIYGNQANRVKTHDLSIGEHSLGVRLRSRAQFHRTPEKRIPLLAGVNKYVVTMEPGYSMPNEFVIRLTGKLFESEQEQEQQQQSQSQQEKERMEQLEKVLEQRKSNEFLARDSSEEQYDDTQPRKYINEYRSQRSVKNEFEIELFTRGSSEKREAKLTANCKVDQSAKLLRCKLQAKRTPIPTKETADWQLESEIEILYPQAPMSVQEITKDKRLTSQMKAQWGPQSGPKSKVNIKLVAEQSREMRRLAEQSVYSRLSQNEQQRAQFRSLFTPVAQYEHTLKYGLLDEIKADIDYKLEDYEKQVLNEVYRYAKQQYYWQSQVSISSQEKTSEGRLRAKLNIDPKSRQQLNITIWTPMEVSRFEDIPLAMQVSSPNMRRMSSPSRSTYHLITQLLSINRPVCKSRTDRIETFDQVEYNMPSSTCYQVIAKDCSSAQNSKFAVLVKKQSANSEKKTVKIITEKTKVELRATEQQGEFECVLNNEQVPCQQLRTRDSKQHPLLNCEKSNEQIVCDLPEAHIRVFFDGYATNVKVSELYKSEICGLCGQFDEQKDNEWTGPQRTQSSRREMLEQYLVRENEQQQCEHEYNERPSRLTYDDERFQDLPESIAGPIRSTEFRVNPVEVTKIIEQGHEWCFSRQPVKKCPKHTFVEERSQSPRKVTYSCIERQNEKADELIERLLSDRVVDVSDLKPSFTEHETEPKTCQKY